MGDTGLLVAIHLGDEFEVVGMSAKPCLVSGQELGMRLARPDLWQQHYLMPFRGYRRLRNTSTIHASITGLDPASRTLFYTHAAGKPGQVAYDVLLIASGVSNGFWRNRRLQSMEEVMGDIREISGRLARADTIAVIGGGASGVNAAANLKEANPGKQVHLFYSRDLPLSEYPPTVREHVSARLRQLQVALHPCHRAVIPDAARESAFTTDAISWESGQPPFKADGVLWATGMFSPNNQFLPPDMLDANGFVKVDRYLRVPGYENVFAVGDIAATDPQRCSARNGGFQVAAHNIRACCNGRGESSLKPFNLPKYRWGSILGVLQEGMRVYTPRGGSFLFRTWMVHRVLYPWLVRKMIYKGVKRE